MTELQNQHKGEKKYGIDSNTKYNTEINNDSSLSINICEFGYCEKCLKKIDSDNHNKRFCDRECEKEYYIEICRDVEGFRVRG